MKTMRSEFKATGEASTLSVGNVPTHITQGEFHMVFTTMKSSKDVVSDAHCTPFIGTARHNGCDHERHERADQEHDQKCSASLDATRRTHSRKFHTASRQTRTGMDRARLHQHRRPVEQYTRDWVEGAD